MAVVAGLFNSDADATAAMDRLMNMHLHDLDTRLYGAEERAKGGETGMGSVPVIPNTSGGYSQGGMVVPFSGRVDWLDKMPDSEERAFYLEGMKEGATLAVAKVDDQDADTVRQLFRQNGARTYEKK